MTCRRAAENFHAAANCELAPGHGCHLPAGKAPRRPACHRMAGAGKGQLLHQRGGHRATRLLGAKQIGEPAAGAAGLAHAVDRGPARAHPWLQCLRRARLGGAGTPARKSRAANAGGGQLHCRHRPAPRLHHRDRKRQGFPAPRPEGIQPLQGAFISPARLANANLEIRNSGKKALNPCFVATALRAVSHPARLHPEHLDFQTRRTNCP